jgi:hypothetical protein
MSATLPAAGLVVATTEVEGAHVQVVRVDNHPAQPLTDAQLRADAVPVSAAALPLPTGAATETTLAALRTAAEAIRSAAETLAGRTLNTGNIGGTVALDGSTLAALESITAATGGLTNAELRASALPVAAASLPLPTGAASESTLEAARALLADLSGAIGNHSDPAADGRAGLVVFAARRRDSDASATVADGDAAFLSVDEESRLKVSTKPASYPDITGDITAIQPTIGTPVAGGTVGGDVSRASNIMAFCMGTFAGVNVTFEGSLELTGDTNWFGLQASRSNSNTIETATGVLAAQPAYSWELSVNALKRVRVRCTARTSGTQSWRFVQGTYATEPIPAAQVSATQPISGTVTATVTPPAPTTPYFVNSAATTNGALVITGTSGLHAFYATNEGATTAYVKLYNKATAPTVGTDVPEMIIPIPAAASGVPGVAMLPIGFQGFRFALGLGIAITGAAVHTDATAVAAGQVKVKLSRTT